MSIVIANKTYKGVSNLLIEIKELGLIMSFPKPMNMVLSDGTDKRDQQSRNDLGEMVRINSFPTSKMPELNISYGSNQPEMFALQTGYRLETGMFDLFLPKTVLVPASGIIPAVTIGLVGYGIDADAPSKASITEAGMSVALDQEASASHATWKATPKTFGVGADGAMYFSNDLVGKIVSIKVPWSVSARTISEQLVGELEVTAVLVNSLNKITIVNIPSAIINVSGTSLDGSAEGFEIRMYPLVPPGRCRAYDIYDLEESVAC